MATENRSGIAAPATSPVRSVDTLERLLRQISDAADVLATFAAESAGDDVQRAMASMHAVQAMAQNIGAMASLGQTKPALSAAHHLVGDVLAQALDVRPGETVATLTTVPAPPTSLEARRREVARCSIIGLMDEIHSLNDTIVAGRPSDAAAHWDDGYQYLERWASLNLSAIDDEVETAETLEARLASMGPLMKPEDREARDMTRKASANRARRTGRASSERRS